MCIDGGDKTTPGLIMGALSMDLPTIFFPYSMSVGMERGTFRFWSDTWKYEDDLREGKITGRGSRGRHSKIIWPLHDNGNRINNDINSGNYWLILPEANNYGRFKSYSISYPNSRRIVEMAWEDLRPSEFSCSSFENAISAAMAMGCSTNAIIRVIPIAREQALFKFDDFDRIGRKVPVIANIRPNGTIPYGRLYYAGGLRAMLKVITKFSKPMLRL